MIRAWGYRHCAEVEHKGVEEQQYSMNEVANWAFAKLGNIS